MENVVAVIPEQRFPAARPMVGSNANRLGEVSAAESHVEQDGNGRYPFLGAEPWSRFLFNLGWSGANQVTRAAAMTLVIILVTRHLGPSAYGSLAFGLSVVKIGVIAAGLGLNRIIVQQLVLKPEATTAVLRGGLLLKGISGFVLVIAAILFLVIFLPNHKTVWLVVIIAGLAILLQTFDTFDCFFQARER